MEIPICLYNSHNVFLCPSRQYCYEFMDHALLNSLKLVLNGEDTDLVINSVHCRVISLLIKLWL